MAAIQPSSALGALQFKNAGVVTAEMRSLYHQHACYYVEDLDQWSTPAGWGGTSSYPYLYVTLRPSADGAEPPTGLRSAVPLGGLGAGTLELRADGSFREWSIFNNSPAGGQKIHLEEALFGLRTSAQGAETRSWTLRTHPPAGLPSIAQIEYAGAFPASRLVFTDPDLSMGVDLFAYCPFHIRDPGASATPAVLFTFRLQNPSEHKVAASLILVVPNHIQGQIAEGKGLALSKGGDDPTSGTMALRVADDDLVESPGSGTDLQELWKAFTEHGHLDGCSAEDRAPNYAAVSASADLDGGETRTLTFVLAWHFPQRPHGQDVVGNFYSSLYTSANHVADHAIGRLPTTQNAIVQWQELCYDNSLPEWLQDSLVNSVATMYKTGMWFGDGRWRQWESFSCPAVEPIHIHLYRSLPYVLLFPSLQQNLLVSYARGQTSDGYIREHLARTNASECPGGRQMGDGCTAFLLALYNNYLWTGDGAFLQAIWPNAKRAAEWQMAASQLHGLPAHLNNTYDWWDFDKKDLVAHNAFLHLAAMLAAEQLARAQKDPEFAAACRSHFESARQALDERFWTGTYYRCWWMADEAYPDALHADTLYGQLWARILGLGWLVETSKVRSHLDAELEKNGSPFGLKVMQGVQDAQRTRDDLVWHCGSLDWASLNIHVGGDVQQSLGEAAKVINHWRERLCDQWNYTDLTTAWDGLPFCNSHYSRQLIFWAIPLALSGQLYSAVSKRLTFEPKLSAPAKLPFFTPMANGTLELEAAHRYTLRVLSGRLELEHIAVDEARVDQEISLSAGQSLVVKD